MKKLIFILLLTVILTGCKLKDTTAVKDLTPIIPIGDGVTVPVYNCANDTDCNRCKDGDVHTQSCKNGTCQGTLYLADVCENSCSNGQCVDEDTSTDDEIDGLLEKDFDLGNNDDAIVNNDELLPDPTQCSPGPEKCPGSQGIGNVYLTPSPECKCTYIYVPPGCNPNQPPCSDYSSRTAYPACACK